MKSLLIDLICLQHQHRCYKNNGFGKHDFLDYINDGASIIFYYNNNLSGDKFC